MKTIIHLIAITALLSWLSGCATTTTPPVSRIPQQEDKYAEQLKEWSDKIDREDEEWKKMPDGPEKAKLAHEILAESEAYNKARREYLEEIDRRMSIIARMQEANAASDIGRAAMMQAMPTPTPPPTQIQIVPYPYP
jgi:hypothetical protein